MTDIAAAALIPLTVMLFEVTTVFSSASGWSVKVNGSGVVSAAAAFVVTLKVSLTPPMFSVAEVMAELLGDEATCTVTACPLLTVPLLLV